MVGDYSLSQKIHFAGLGISRTLRRWQYALLAIAVAFVFSALIFFFINLNFYWPLFTSALPLADKFGLVGTIASDTIASYFASVNGVLLLVVSVLQGASIGTLAYVMRRNRENDKATASAARRSGIATIMAALGLGCVPCGTAVILPIVSIVFSGSSAAIAANVTNLVLLIIALLLSIYSVYKIGGIAYQYTEADKLLQETGDKS